MTPRNWTHHSISSLFEKAIRPLTEDEMISLELDVEGMRQRNIPKTGQ